MLLIAQIIAIQSLLYVSLGFIMAIMDIFVGANHTLDHLFQYHVSIWPQYSQTISLWNHNKNSAHRLIGVIL